MKEKKSVVCLIFSVFCILMVTPCFVLADESKLTKRVEGVLGFYYGGLSGEYSDDDGRDYEVDNLAMELAMFSVLVFGLIKFLERIFLLD